MRTRIFSEVRLAELKANYAGTRLYKQEIEGVFNDDVAGALFTLDMITEARIDRAELPDLARVVVAVDPAQTSPARAPTSPASSSPATTAAATPTSWRTARCAAPPSR